MEKFCFPITNQIKYFQHRLKGLILADIEVECKLNCEVICHDSSLHVGLLFRLVHPRATNCLTIALGSFHVPWNKISRIKIENTALNWRLLARLGEHVNRLAQMPRFHVLSTRDLWRAGSTSISVISFKSTRNSNVFLKFSLGDAISKRVGTYDDDHEIFNFEFSILRSSNFFFKNYSTISIFLSFSPLNFKWRWKLGLHL